MAEPLFAFAQRLLSSFGVRVEQAELFLTLGNGLPQTFEMSFPQVTIDSAERLESQVPKLVKTEQGFGQSQFIERKAIAREAIEELHSDLSRDKELLEVDLLAIREFDLGTYQPLMEILVEAQRAINVAFGKICEKSAYDREIEIADDFASYISLWLGQVDGQTRSPCARKIAEMW
jgi:hypothetical protein